MLHALLQAQQSKVEEETEKTTNTKATMNLKVASKKSLAKRCRRVSSM